MKISILTLFPEMFVGPFDHSIIKRAQEKKLVEIEYSNIRDHGIGRHKVVDDTPYGGGHGMLMRVDVLDKAISNAKCQTAQVKCLEKIVLLDARGEKFTQKKAREYATMDHIILIAGHYEGVDERVRSLVDEVISIGDFVSTGGEIPAMLIADATVRLIPGAIAETGTDFESFSLTEKGISHALLEYPQYTKPQEYKHMKVPDILLSGNHQKIHEWRLNQALRQTKQIRPDLLKKKNK